MSRSGPRAMTGLPAIRLMPTPDAEDGVQPHRSGPPARGRLDVARLLDDDLDEVVAVLPGVHVLDLDGVARDVRAVGLRRRDDERVAVGRAVDVHHRIVRERRRPERGRGAIGSAGRSLRRGLLRQAGALPVLGRGLRHDECGRQHHHEQGDPKGVPAWGAASIGAVPGEADERGCCHGTMIAWQPEASLKRLPAGTGLSDNRGRPLERGGRGPSGNLQAGAGTFRGRVV